MSGALRHSHAARTARLMYNLTTAALVGGLVLSVLTIAVTSIGIQAFHDLNDTQQVASSASPQAAKEAKKFTESKANFTLLVAVLVLAVLCTLSSMGLLGHRFFKPRKPQE